MAIEIKITDSEITGRSRVLNNLSSEGDIVVQIDHTKIEEAAEALNNLTDNEVKDVIKVIEEQAKLLEKRSEEYQRINMLLTEVRKPKCSVKETLKKYLPELFVGTFANVLGGILLK